MGLLFGHCAWAMDKVWPTFNRQVYDCNVSLSSSGSKKNADGDCELAVETLQDCGKKVCQICL